MKKAKKHEKYIKMITGLIIGAAFGVVIGLSAYYFTSAEPNETNKTNDILAAAILLLSLYSGIFLHLILHEAGHLLGGFISGYQLISFRVFNLAFVKDNNKLQIKKYGIAGTMGQCLMTPPGQPNDHFPYRLYNLSGGIMNVLCSGLFFAFFVILRNSFYLSGVIFIPLIGVGMLLGMANLIPLKMSGIANDGYNVIALNKNADARRAFFITLHVNASSAKGIRYKDMPAEWFNLPEDYNNPLTVTIALAYLNCLLDNHDFNSAKVFAEKILADADKILEIYRNELRCDLLFFELIGECRKEEIEKLYTDQLKKYIKASGSHLSKRRLMYAYARLFTHNEIETGKALRKLNKTFLTFPYRGELELERELVDLIDETAKQRA